jgi:GNAT superfamily N-acetyltransferase
MQAAPEMLTIRQGTQQDHQLLVDFQLAMAIETEQLQLDRPTVEKGVQRVLDEPVRGTYWVAEANGKLVASLLTLSEWSDWRNGEVIWVHSVYVVSEYRRKGVFRQMYLRLKQEVETRNDLKGLRLYVEKNNQNAQSVYRSLGMTDEHYQLFEWLK